jgi:hypothetical protein
MDKGKAEVRRSAVVHTVIKIARMHV